MVMSQAMRPVVFLRHLLFSVPPSLPGSSVVQVLRFLRLLGGQEFFRVFGVIRGLSNKEEIMPKYTQIRPG